MTFRNELIGYIKASYSLLLVETPEESRSDEEICRAALDTNRAILVWSHTEGMQTIKIDDDNGITVSGLFDTKDPVAMCKELKGQITSGKIKASVIIFRDFHPFFKNPAVTRYMRDFAKLFKSVSITGIIVTSVVNIPKDLEQDITIIDMKLPVYDELKQAYDLVEEACSISLSNKNIEITDEEKDRIINAAAGLTLNEAENAFAKAMVSFIVNNGEGQSISRMVMSEKALSVKKSGILEYYECSENADSIGGLEVLKEWIEKRSRAFSSKAREFGLPTPKGILLAGLPGCGKSLTAKVASNILQVPLIKFDISKVFGGLVGQSETQMRSALKVIDTIGACVVWVDEAEKAIAGSGGSGSTDSGVTKRVFGNFLTWMQDKSSPSFIVMTVNNISSIVESSPEMLRKGRFDQLFFVGLPNESERAAIFKIHLAKYVKSYKDGDFNISKFVECSDGFSGAEIEQAIVEGMYTAFDRDEKLIDSDIIEALESCNPLSISSSASLDRMKEWAEDNAINASIIDNKKAVKSQSRRAVNV